MVVPTYLGTMALGGVAGIPINSPYNSLLMSNMSAMGLQMTNSMPTEHTSYGTTHSYQGFPPRLPLPTQVAVQAQAQQQGGQAAQKTAGESGSTQETCLPTPSSKSFTPEPAEHQSPPPSTALDEVNAAYLAELEAEKEKLEAAAQSEDNNSSTTSSHLLRLLENEISHIQSGGGRTSSQREHIKYFDIYRERPVRLTVRALIPVREHPKFNFVGKLLGPKGNSMKRLQEETMTKMAVLGRGSMRDKQKEEELRSSADPKYQHLAEDLHVEITAFAPPAEAHARIAYALTEVRKYLIPDSNDEIRQEQMREMELISTNGDVIDSLKQQAANPAQLILHSFPGQGGGGPVLHHAAAPMAPSSTFLAAPFLAAAPQSTIPAQELPDRQENDNMPSSQAGPWQGGLKAASTFHNNSSARSAAACPYSKPAPC